MRERREERLERTNERKLPIHHKKFRPLCLTEREREGGFSNGGWWKGGWSGGGGGDEGTKCLSNLGILEGNIVEEGT